MLTMPHRQLPIPAQALTLHIHACTTADSLHLMCQKPTPVLRSCITQRRAPLHNRSGRQRS